MTFLDWVLVCFVALTGLGGLRSGLFATVLSLAGLVAGAVVGARIAVEAAGGDGVGWASLVALGGAVAGAVLLRAAARVVAGSVRGGLRFLPPLRWLDSAGGLAFGVGWGLALVWVGAAVASVLPGLPEVRSEVDRSSVVRRLNELAPPPDLLDLGTRIELPALGPPR